MIALQDIENWNGVSAYAGERFEVEPHYAAALTYKRMARFVNEHEAESIEAITPKANDFGPSVMVDLNQNGHTPSRRPTEDTKALDTKPKRKPRKHRRDIPKAPRTKVLH